MTHDDCFNLWGPCDYCGVWAYLDVDPGWKSALPFLACQTCLDAKRANPVPLEAV